MTRVLAAYIRVTDWVRSDANGVTPGHGVVTRGVMPPETRPGTSFA